jgi:TolA-binding protein
VPVKFHIRERQDMFDRFRAQWTPTQLVVDADGNEIYRIEGFLPTEDFLAQLEMGRARADFSAGRFREAERRFQSIVERRREARIAPEARYWAGVSAYKATNDSKALRETAVALRERWPDDEWTRKASVWSG